MTSSAREILKWLALVLMTGDHAVKVLAGGYVPVVSELGRIAFPLFAFVMAYNLAQPGADYAKSFRRLSIWGLVAQPVYAWTFDALLPVNVLFSFALAVACCWAVENRRWGPLLVLAGPIPMLVDYQWSGVAFVLAWWWFFRTPQGLRGDGTIWIGVGRLWLAFAAFAPLCVYNGNPWALAALFPMYWLGDPARRLPAVRRTRWGFYGYYVGHLVLLALIALVVA